MLELVQRHTVHDRPVYSPQHVALQDPALAAVRARLAPWGQRRRVRAQREHLDARASTRLPAPQRQAELAFDAARRVAHVSLAAVGRLRPAPLSKDLRRCTQRSIPERGTCRRRHRRRHSTYWRRRATLVVCGHLRRRCHPKRASQRCPLSRRPVPAVKQVRVGVTNYHGVPVSTRRAAQEEVKPSNAQVPWLGAADPGRVACTGAAWHRVWCTQIRAPHGPGCCGWGGVSEPQVSRRTAAERRDAGRRCRAGGRGAPGRGSAHGAHWWRGVRLACMAHGAAVFRRGGVSSVRPTLHAARAARCVACGAPAGTAPRGVFGAGITCGW